MSSYLTRLKQLQSEKNSLYIPDPLPPKPPKAPFDGFAGTPQGVNVKKYSNTFGISDHTAEPTTAEKLHELDLLIEYVAISEGFSNEDIIEAKNNAENDVENALLSFRELASTVRQVKVLNILKENPESRMAVYADTVSNQYDVIITVAILGHATCDCRVSKTKYDPFRLLDLIEKYGQQTH